MNDLATLRHNAKTLRKAANKESQGSLRNYLEAQARKSELLLARSIQNESYYSSPRNSWKKLPQVKFEEVS
jgi:lambda repressor-like predicted transcriptional regulator